MTKRITKEIGVEKLNSIIGKRLMYSYKYPRIDMYAFGFGDYLDVTTPEGKHKLICPSTIHNVCNFKVIKRAGCHSTKIYHKDTPEGEFRTDISNLLGLKVERFDISDKNDLWLDLGEYWIVFITFENYEESWRFFTPYSQGPHLVATGISLEFDL